MAAFGWCPSGRLFEAAACGTPIVSDWWEGLDEFFEPQSEIIVVRTTEDVLAALERSDTELSRIGAAARERVLTGHTAARRAAELEMLAVAVGGIVAMWGIVPAAGSGTRIQPLAFSKELLPVGSRFDGATERPRAVSEYLIERMLKAGADKICFVISPWKSDILQYYGGMIGPAAIAYVVQPEPAGLCDAIFRALPLIQRDDLVLVGLPDTIWLPDDALARLPDDRLAFLTFPVDRPELFDAVVSDDKGRVREIQVKRRGAASRWVWGAFKLPGAVLHDLHRLWCERDPHDEYVGTLVNAYLAAGGDALAVPSGTAYVDVGTLGGYREAMRLLRDAKNQAPSAVTPIRFAARSAR